MKLSERLRNEINLTSVVSDVGKTEAYNAGVAICAMSVEELEARLLKIATDAREQVISPSFDVSARQLSKLLGSVLREIEEVVGGEV